MCGAGNQNTYCTHCESGHPCYNGYIARQDFYWRQRVFQWSERSCTHHPTNLQIIWKVWNESGGLKPHACPLPGSSLIILRWFLSDSTRDKNGSAFRFERWNREKPDIMLADLYEWVRKRIDYPQYFIVRLCSAARLKALDPRYCPSLLSDKVNRFADKKTSETFIEPERNWWDEMYIQGMSSSLWRCTACIYKNDSDRESSNCQTRICNRIWLYWIHRTFGNWPNSEYRTIGENSILCRSFNNKVDMKKQQHRKNMRIKCRTEKFLENPFISSEETRLILAFHRRWK